MLALTDFALIAEIVAAVGIITSLIFVYLELRRGNTEARQRESQGVVKKMNTYRGLTNDPVISDLVYRGRQGLDQLTGPERLSFDRYLRQSMATILAVRTTMRSGHVEEHVLKYLVRTTIRDELNHHGALEWWKDRATKRMFGMELVRMIDDALDQTEDDMEAAWSKSFRTKSMI